MNMLKRQSKYVLKGYVGLGEAFSLLDDVIGVGGKPAPVEISCADVADFTGAALVELARAQRELRKAGADLVLTGCPRHVKDRLVHPLFEGLLG